MMSEPQEDPDLRKNPVICPILVELTIDLALAGPFLTHSAAAGPWGVDAVCARDALGRLYLEGPHVKGKLREGFDDFEDGGDPFDDSTGKNFSRAKEFEARDFGLPEEDEIPSGPGLASQVAGTAPERYPALVYDFLALAEWPKPGESVITRVRINEETGSADPGGLWMIDSPVAPGQEIVFRGEIRFSAPDVGKAEEYVNSIMAGLAWICGFGANQSTGFGKLIDASLRRVRTHSIEKKPNVMSVGAEALSGTAPSLMFVDWELRDPVCVPRGLVNGNVFESEEELRGDILKGAVAESLRRIVGVGPGEDLQTRPENAPFALLCSHFSGIRFTTARPWYPTAAGRPTVPPHSLAIGVGQVYDFALVEQWDHPDFAPVVDGRAVSFLHDWKPRDAQLVRDLFQAPSTVHELRVRTAIDSRSRRARDQELFSYRIVRPEGIVWRGTVGFVPPSGLEVDQVREVLRQLANFLNIGWIHIGKTKARARGKIMEALDPDKLLEEARLRTRQDSVCVVTLQSNAIMVDPWEAVDDTGANAADETTDDLYSRYWDEVSNGAFACIRKFITHRLDGGFQAERFRRIVDGVPDGERFDPDLLRARQKAQPYNPALLTEAGSVFVLTPTKVGDEPDQVIRGWLQCGLPLPKWTARAYGKTFHTNPYLPENGYGEIAVNLRCHSTLKPNKQELGQSVVERAATSIDA